MLIFIVRYNSLIKMELYLSFFALLLCSFYVYGDTVCWDKTWYNDSLTFKNGSSYEHQSLKVLDKICPDGSPVIAARCQDEKGEPFNNTNNDKIGHFIAVCNHINGLTCNPYKNVTNAVCPDFAIQYGCKKCKSNTTETVTPQNVKASTTVTNSLSERTTKTVYVTKNPASIAPTTSFGASTKTTIGTGSSSTGNGGNGSKSATIARRHHCKNSAPRFESVVLLLALSTFVYKLVQ